MACTRENIKFDGLNIWSDEAGSGRAPKVDIIAVQNLGEHSYDTWVKQVPSSPLPEPQTLRNKFGRLKLSKAKQRQEPGVEDLGASYTEVMWLRDLLAPSIDDARVAAYNYTWDWGFGDVQVSLQWCADRFLRALLDYRENQTTPIILIGHGIGNLVIQQALVLAVDQKSYASIAPFITGIIFLGTPFQARSDFDFKNWLSELKIRDEALSKELVKHHSELYNVVGKFWGKSSSWEVACFNEKSQDGLTAYKLEYLSRQTETMDKLLLKILDVDYSNLNKFCGHDDRNFRFLLDEIQRMVDCGASIVAENSRPNFHEIKISKGYKNVHWTVPKPVNDLFIGRDEILSQMQSAFSDENSPLDKQKRFVITGMGGQGKSEICLKFANIMQDKFWAVFWIDVGDPSTARAGFIDLAKRLGYSVERVQEALQVLATVEEKWLLILDNADDHSFNYQEYIPSGLRGAIIITSRVPGCKRYNTVGTVALDGLEENLPVELLLSAADLPKDKWPIFTSQANAIVKILGAHTLALIQAGAYIAGGHCQISQYPEVFQEQKKQLLEYHEDQAQSRYSNVYATFEASAKVLEQSGSEKEEDALQLLGILSMLAASFLPLQIFELAWASAKEYKKDYVPEYIDIGYPTKEHVSHLPGIVALHSDKWNSKRLTTAASLLASLSLVKRHEMGGSIGLSMHPLAHAWAKERQGSKQHALSWLSAGCVFVFAQGEVFEWRGQEQIFLPHILSYLSTDIAKAFSFGSPAFVTAMLVDCSWALLAARQNAQLQDFLDRLNSELNIDADELPRLFPCLAKMMGLNLSAMGKNEEALKLLEAAMPTFNSKMPPDHFLFWSLKHCLAGVYLELKRLPEAVNLFEQVVQARKIEYPESSPSLLASQHQLARAYLENDQASEGIKLLEHVVQIKQATLDSDHPALLVSQHELARVYYENKQLSEGLELLKNVVRIRKAILASDHPDLLSSQYQLAIAYVANSQAPESVELLKDIVRIRKGIVASNHPDLLISQYELASAYLETGQVLEAIELFKHIVQIREAILARDHPYLLVSQHELARAYFMNGQLDESIEIFTHVVSIQASLPKNDPSRISSEQSLEHVTLQREEKRLKESGRTEGLAE